MKASVYSQYGPPDVIRLEDIETPVPGPTEVLVRIHATTVSAGDWRMRSLDMPAGFGPIGRLVAGISGPRQPVLGSDLAGVVAAIGSDVTKYAVGDEVIAYRNMGCHAEYTTIDENGKIAAKPGNLTFAQAAAIPFGGLTALEFLRDKSNLRPGEKVLVVGASGATGSSAVQLAKHFGCEVTGVCSTANVDLVRSLGADNVIDYTREDFTENGQRYDIIVDTTGTAPWARAKSSLTSKGRLAVISGSLGDMLRAPFVSRRNGKKLVVGVSTGSAEALRTLALLTQEGNFTPIVERIYPFEMIARAHAHVDTGRKKGSVVVAIVPDEHEPARLAG